jgi:hypothetical protein
LAELPIGALLCLIRGATLRPALGWHPERASSVDHAGAAAGVRRRSAPRQLRHAHAVEMAHEGIPRVVIQRQLGPDLGITSICLQGVGSSEILCTVHGRASPTISASASLRINR